MGAARAALWLWHAPPLFEAALASEAVHYLQHLTLLITALLFWASILPRRADVKTRVVAVFSLFTTSMHSTLLGALLTLSPTVWYASYAGVAVAGRLSALEDQQLAGCSCGSRPASPKIDPLSAMPATGVSEAEARDTAAYLYTLH